MFLKLQRATCHVPHHDRFENRLSLAWNACNQDSPVYIEDESRSVGKIAIPVRARVPVLPCAVPYCLVVLLLELLLRRTKAFVCELPKSVIVWYIATWFAGCGLLDSYCACACVFGTFRLHCGKEKRPLNSAFALRWSFKQGLHIWHCATCSDVQPSSVLRVCR